MSNAANDKVTVYRTLAKASIGARTFNNASGKARIERAAARLASITDATSWAHLATCNALTLVELAEELEYGANT